VRFDPSRTTAMATALSTNTHRKPTESERETGLAVVCLQETSTSRLPVFQELPRTNEPAYESSFAPIGFSHSSETLPAMS
jgi:hypothetical protein